MPKQKRLGEDGYKRPQYTEQDIISSNVGSIKEKLNNFIRVDSNFHKDIPCGIWIKYVTYQGLYRSGGILITNKSPDYLVLKNPSKKHNLECKFKKKLHLYGKYKREN